MDADTVFEFLKAVGPFSMPLCVGMAWSVRWLVKQLNLQKDELVAARADALAVREKRADDLEKSAREYAEQGESMRNTLREWAVKADLILNRG